MTKQTVLIGEENYIIISNKDIEQFQEALDVLKKEITLAANYTLVPIEIFAELEKANKRYKNLLLKKEKAIQVLEGCESQFNSLKEDIEEYAPEVLDEFSGLMKRMEAVPLQELQTSKFNLLFKLNKSFAQLASQNMEEIERVKTEGLGRYVYCLIPSNEVMDFGEIGLFRKKVYTIPYGNISAVVSKLPLKDYRSFNFEENVKTHDRVIQHVMERFTVIPLAYNQTWKNEDLLETFVRGMEKDANNIFKKLEGKEEFGLKVLKNNGTFKEDELITDLKELRNTTSSAKLGEKFNNEMVLNSFYLVSKERVKEFSDKVEEIKNKHNDLEIKLTGPWPPYNFVEIKIGGENVCA